MTNQHNGKLCENIVLVSKEEYQKLVSDTSVQHSTQTTDDTPTKVETQVQVGQIDQSQEDAKDTPKEEEQ